MKANPYRTKERPNNVYATVFEKGRAVGIEEVVEWVEANSSTCAVEKHIRRKEWQAKLKEWGIWE